MLFEIDEILLAASPCGLIVLLYTSPAVPFQVLVDGMTSGFTCPEMVLEIPLMSCQSNAYTKKATGAPIPLSASLILSKIHFARSTIFSPSQVMASATNPGTYQ